jgi:hypothetical protein
MIFKINTAKPPKKTLDDLLANKSAITGKEIIQKIKEQEKNQREFDEAVEVEKRYKKY